MNFAIVGCGFIAKKHAQAIQNIEGTQLIAVCDRVPSLMHPYVEEYEAKPYTDIEEMLKNDAIDIVCICTPSGTHAMLAELIASHGKHIVVEKPIAMTMEDADRMIEVAKYYEVKLAVVHPNRFRPVAQKLKEILDQNMLGKISHALCIVNWSRGQEYYDQASWRGTKEFDGGVLMNQAIHNLDLLQWYLGEPEDIISMSATRLHDIEVEDVSTGVIRFKSGVLATVQASTNVYPKNYEESITIFGEKGTVKIGGPNALFFETLDVQDMSEDSTEQLIESVKEDPWGRPGHQAVLEDMIEAVQLNHQPAVSGKDGRDALRLVLSFYETSDTTKPKNLV